MGQSAITANASTPTQGFPRYTVRTNPLKSPGVTEEHVTLTFPVPKLRPMPRPDFLDRVTRRPSDRTVRAGATAGTPTPTAAAESLEDRALLTTFVVDTAADVTAADGRTSLREAINAANARAGFDTVLISEDLVDAADRIVLNAGLNITDRLGLSGSGMTIDASRLRGESAFTVAAGSRQVVIGDLVVRDGNAVSGGAILFEAGGGDRLGVRNAFFVNNVATGGDVGQGGGAILQDGGSVLVRESSFVVNAAVGASGSGGAILSRNGRLDVVDVIMQRNESNRAGGAIEVGTSAVRVFDSEFLGNQTGTGPRANAAAPGNGGAIHTTFDAAVRIQDSEFEGNRAGNEGGALWGSGGTRMLVLRSDLERNVAFGNFDGTNEGGGGAIFNDGGVLRVSESEIQENVAAGRTGTGGGIFANGGQNYVFDTELELNRASRAGGGMEVFRNAQAFVVNSDFDSNSAGGINGRPAAPGNGGAIHVGGNSATTRINGTDFDDNVAANEGGALWNNAGSSLFLSDSELEDNASFEGGGLFNNGGSMTLRSVEVEENDAFGSRGTGDGAGLYNLAGGRVTAFDTEFRRNEADRDGGGIFNAGSLVLVRGEVEDNDADDDGRFGGTGGGVYTEAGGTTDVRGTEFDDNSPDDFGGPGAVI